METDDTTTTPTPDGPAPRQARRLARSPRDRVIAGVAGGLGEYFGVDAVLFRIAFVALTVAGGSGLALYLLAWLVLPETDDNERAGERVSRWFRQKPVLAIIGTVIAVNVVADGWWWGDRHRSGNDFFWGIVLVGLGVAFLVNRQRGRWTASTTGTVDPEPTAPGPTLTGDPLLDDAARLEAGGRLTDEMWPPSPPTKTVAVVPRHRPFLTPVTISVLLVGGGIAALFGMALQTYLGVALLVVGAAMLIGSRFGRARGLIAVGLALAAAATFTSAVDLSLEGGAGTRLRRPTRVAQLQPYRLGVGELTLDLRDLDFVGTQAIEARIGFGELRVLVPDDVQVEADTHVGLGEVRGFGSTEDGVSVDRTFRRTAGSETGRRLQLDLDAGIGEITVEAS